MTNTMSSATSAAGERYARAASRSAAAERLGLVLLWIVGFSGGFVLIEPAPYEFLTFAAFLFFAAGGLTIGAAHLPLFFLLIVYCISLAIGVMPVLSEDKTLLWTVVSCFMASTALFYALVLGDNTQRRLDSLLAGYVASAMVISAIAILAYFGLLPSAETFLHLGRAKATFKDPNVFGPFLVLPGLLLVQRAMFGGARDLIFAGAKVLVIAGALLLSFSRGAWAHFAASTVVMLILCFIAARSTLLRLRIILLAVAGAIAIAFFLIALLSLPQVAELFEERASLVQGYDAGQLGRFGRHLLGALMIFDYPLGIGPMQFSKYLPEDPHNSFLDAFMTGGWLGGVTWLALMLITLLFGLRHAFRATQWQMTYIAVFATYVGEFGESYIIDVQHWRHYFLILGLLWGLMAVQSRAAGPAGARA